MMLLSKYALAIFLLTWYCGYADAQADPPSSVPVKVVPFLYNPNNSSNAYTRLLSDYMRKNPQVKVEQWGGISLPGGNASLMMSIAGNTSPDIGLGFFHMIRNDIKQKFLYPLNEWIGDDLNGNGVIDDDELKYPEWKSVRPLWREVATVDGKVYGLPVPLTTMQAVIFRIDMVKAAGLDPNKPPRDWDEFYEWCKALTDPAKQIKGAQIQQGQRAIALPAVGYQFLPWIQSAGGEPFVQIKTSPRSGREYRFPIDAERFMTPDGEDLSGQPSTWRADLDTPESMEALAFWHKLRWGEFESDGRKIQGVARQAISGARGSTGFDLLGNGEVAMIIDSVDNLDELAGGSGVDPAQLSWFPVPAAPGPGGRQVVQVFQHYIVMYANVAQRSKAERDAVWGVFKTIISSQVLKNAVQAKVLGGMSRFVPPELLLEFNYDEYLQEIPAAIQNNFDKLKNGEIQAKTEPYMGFWSIVGHAISREVLGLMLGANGEHFNAEEALATVNRKANGGMMFDRPQEFFDQYRPVARFVLAGFVLIIAFFLYKMFHGFRAAGRGAKSVYSGWLPLLLLLPALLIIGCWKYYPLLRGMVMAVQEYRVVGESEFVGLNNFIALAFDRSFWMSMVRTGYFVLLNMILAFLAPIGLSILLTEVPKGKIFYRTLFFLPHMTSGIVIALMWKLMYSPTPAGFFNQIIAYLNYLPGVDIGVQSWLEDPKMAMICCIVPTVWAGMGMSSLIYLAALQSLPSELYEAAEIDGAGLWHKFTKITVPYLLPLIVINFVGTFIATFQGMGNIFLMTFGGPGEATTVVGLKIWQEAYLNLRFSMATSMAWVLGTGLIGLTYLQIQILKKVEYKKSSE